MKKRAISMKPPRISQQYSLHSVPLATFLDPMHELLLLALALPWARLEERFGVHFKPGKGRPPIATRVMIALHLLKYLYDESDESVVARVAENPYWQAFCGFVEFQHRPPCEASSLTRWRRKVGPDAEALLSASLLAARKAGMAKPEDFRRAVLDTTVQTKAVTPPTDGKLLYAMHARLLREAKAREIKVPRPHRREMRVLKREHARLRHNLHHTKAARKLRRMRTLVRRVERQIGRGFAQLDETLVHQLQRSARLRAQTRGLVPFKERIFSVHAPEVECITKGKTHRPWEFGVTVALATTPGKHPLVMAALPMPGSTYDGMTTQATLDECGFMTGEAVVEACADRGFRGKRWRPRGAALFIAGTRKLGGLLRKFVGRRVIIEPVIGHCKSEHKLERNGLKGALGDRLNAWMSATAWNLAQLMRWLAAHPRAAVRLLAALWRLLRLCVKLPLNLAVQGVRSVLAASNTLAPREAAA